MTPEDKSPNSLSSTHSSRAKNVDRSIDELIGVAKGLTADGSLNEAKIQFLVQWMNENEHCAAAWPANKLFPKLSHMLDDCEIDPQEGEDLFKFLKEIQMATKEGNELANPIPFTDPPPKIVFFNRQFCLIGRFSFGSRRLLEAEIEKRSGRIADQVYMNTNYLVVGFLGYQDWKGTREGETIETAMKNRAMGIPIGAPIVIVREDHLIAEMELKEG